MIVAIAGCGEVGRCYAAALSTIRGTTIVLCDPSPTTTALALAETLGCTVHQVPGPWLKDADLVVSAVFGQASLDLLRSSLPFLQATALFADFTTAAPEAKRLASEEAVERGISYIDVAIMGAISLSGALTPLLLAGEKARRMAELLSPLGADLRVLEGGRPGDAVSLKLLRSIFTKGMEALTVECLIAAEHFGVREQLFTVLSDLDKVPLRAFMEMLLRTHVVHAGRRHHEVIEAEKQLVKEKLPTYVLPGVRALFANTCAALNREPVAASSPDAKQALSWLQQASTAGAR